MATATKTKQLAVLLVRAQRAQLILRKDYPDWRRAWRARDRERKRWAHWSSDTLAALRAALPTDDELARRAIRERGGLLKRLLRKDSTFDPAAFTSRLRADLNEQALADQALAFYLSVALDTGEVAGQYSLDALGLDATFAWANPENMAQALYEVRGSKVIQGIYGTHLDQLTTIIERATDPRTPMTIGQVTKEIRESWDTLEKWQAERIARTETAAVWSNTSLNALIANGCPSFESLISTGPSVGVDVSAACEECVDIAAGGPYTSDTVPEPPYHPNCACELIPGEDFLPPDEPWTGGDATDLLPAASEF